MVKQEIARVKIGILGISELKWMGMGEFNSDDHFIYYCGQESLRRNGAVLKVNRRIWNAVLGYSFKNDRMISVCFKRCTFHHRGIEWKGRKSRDTQNNRQVWSWGTKWSRVNANRVFSQEDAGHSKYPFPITQETALHMDISRWSILKSDWLCSLQPKTEKLYTVSKNMTWSWLWLRSPVPYCKIQA